MTNLASGRVNQKLRTREQLVAAALTMVRAGRTPSVAEVADAARVSRTTAYRYFPTPETLLAEAVFSLVGAPDDRVLYEFFAQCDDLEERVDAVLACSETSISEHEAEYRAMLRLSLDPSLQIDETMSRRPAYRRKWLTDALAPVRRKLGPRRFEELVCALSLCVGVESTVVLRDICRLDPGAARTLKRKVLSTLLHDALGATDNQR